VYTLTLGFLLVFWPTKRFDWVDCKISRPFSDLIGFGIVVECQPLLSCSVFFNTLFAGDAFRRSYFRVHGPGGNFCYLILAVKSSSRYSHFALSPWVTLFFILLIYTLLSLFSYFNCRPHGEESDPHPPSREAPPCCSAEYALSSRKE